ncbi:MetQ/NlpA family ABC transporter substrate-binding protein [Weissella diestrammenae]|uniref:MetQ/NlpA family ABC transporter substrate-binding protein n=1 Tax=Weissella diestrammenae TaxID=1162633 RepID=UPI001FAC3FB9|nr:MetQ/NlpA family ABC transporter substrate-binding protein [Weissella diestrammenae]
MSNYSKHDLRFVSSRLGLVGVIITLGINMVGFAANKTVKVGIVGASDQALWQSIKRTAKQKYGVTIKLNLFTDYLKPNQALVDRSIDLNAFQTINYFNVQNQKLGHQLVAVGKTYITPIRLYSLQHQQLSQLPDGAEIAIPNDPSNEQRALDVLEAAKLIQYNHAVKLPTAKDVTSNPHQFKIKELQSDQIVGALHSVDAAIVNTNYAHDAKLADKTVLFTEPVNKNTKGYVNLIVAHKGMEKNASYQAVVKAYQTESTKKNSRKYTARLRYLLGN